MRPWVAVAISTVVAYSVQPATARDHIWIVGPAASLPFAKAVAARVASVDGGPAPVVEHAETTLGLNYLCEGTGAEHPDAVAATRRMTKAELDTCVKHGISEIVEIPVGIDLLVLAQSRAGPAMRLTLEQMFLALAMRFPDEYGDMTLNPYRRWSEIDAALPNTAIDVRVLQRFSDTREALQQILLQKGAQRIPRIAKQWAMVRALPRAVWAMREEHEVVVTHENEQVIARELVRHSAAIGILDYRFLHANASTLRAVAIDGVEPTPENAYAGKYPGTRTLYLYVRKADIGRVPGLHKLGAEYVSSAALGADGYLLKLGFVPLPMDAMLKTMVVNETRPPVRRDTLPD